MSTVVPAARAIVQDVAEHLLQTKRVGRAGQVHAIDSRRAACFPLAGRLQMDHARRQTSAKVAIEPSLIGAA